MRINTCCTKVDFAKYKCTTVQLRIQKPKAATFCAHACELEELYRLLLLGRLLCRYLAPMSRPGVSDSYIKTMAHSSHTADTEDNNVLELGSELRTTCTKH